ncbi:MAG: MFS transporter [Gammaproteobacteria bacterium]|nr:MFS transporter [Gammaproteobacteria bacterium]
MELASLNPKITLFAFPLGHLANDWAPSAIWLLAPAIAFSMGLSPGEVGLLIAIHSIGASLAYIPAGLLGDHFRNRGLLLAATFWWVAIGYFVAASAPGFWTLAVLLAVGGMGDAAWHPIATGVMVQQMPNRRAQVLGIHAMGGTLAEVGAPLCVGFLLASFDWRTVLELSVIPAVLMGLVFLRIARYVSPSRQHGLSMGDIHHFLHVWLRPAGLWIIAIVTTYNMSWMAIMSMTPLFLQGAHGYSPAQTGIVFAAMLLIGSFAQPLLGRLSDVVGRKRVIVGTIAGAIVCSASIPFLDQPVGLISALIAVAGLLVGVRAVILAAMVEMAGRRESTTLGLAFTIMDGIGALGAVFAGLASSMDLRYAFLVAAALAAATVIMATRHAFTPTIVGVQAVNSD